MAQREIIHTDSAPRAVGPYSQAIRVGSFVFTAGQIAINPVTNTFMDGDIRQQAHQVLNNLSAVLNEAGSSMDNVVKTTVFLSDMNNYAALNEVYSEFFFAAKPARSTVAVAKLPLGALVEIECVALVTSI